MMIIPDCIPNDVWADITLSGLLDARDVMRVAEVVVLPPTSRRPFVASRVLTVGELDWFLGRHITVALWVEMIVDAGTGDRVWYRNGLLHRGDGLPAVERTNGERVWAEDERGFYQILTKHGDLSRLKDHRWHTDDVNIPSNEWADGTREWRHKGRLHRDGDLPAVEFSDGTRHWYKHGVLYRTKRGT